MRFLFTSRWKSIALVALCFAFLPSPVQGADKNGQFAIKGIGRQTCRQFTDARVAGSEVYAQFRGWLEGFLTAVNRYEPETYDAAPWGTTELLALIIDNHCQKNPDDRFVIAVQKLTIKLKEDRLTESSPLLVVTVGGRTARVYEDLLQRIQVQLAELGLYDGTVDGQFGPKTEEAIAMFQVSEGLKGTGLPDPLTVWILVRP